MGAETIRMGNRRPLTFPLLYEIARIKGYAKGWVYFKLKELRAKGKAGDMTNRDGKSYRERNDKILLFNGYYFIPHPRHPAPCVLLTYL